MSFGLYFAIAVLFFVILVFICGWANESSPDVIGPFIVVAALWPLILPVGIIVGVLVGIWHLGRFIGRSFN